MANPMPSPFARGGGSYGSYGPYGPLPPQGSGYGVLYQAGAVGVSLPGASSQGSQPPSYDPYGYAGEQFAAAAEVPNGPSGELNDTVVPGSDEGPFSAFRWLLAWGVLISLLVLFNRTRVGHVVIYYGLLLMLILLIVVNYGWVAWVLRPLTYNRAQQQEEAASIARDQADSQTPTSWLASQATAQGPAPLPTTSSTTGPTSRYVPTTRSSGILPLQ